MIKKSAILKFTESDVEMKLIYPLLTKENPEGLGLKDYHVQTKLSLKKILVDKGSSSKMYYPDFAVIVNGLPTIIIEAKKPNENLDEAYRQACLYAAEVNRGFPQDINPCQFVISTDGLTLYAGNWDGHPEMKIDYDNWNFTDIEFDKFISNYSLTNLTKVSDSNRAKLGTGSTFKNPMNLLGGKMIKNLESNNTFGETISIQYEHLFNPKLDAEKENIVKNAYVKQSRIESHVSPIDSIFSRKLIQQGIHTIENIEEPNKLTQHFENPENLNNKVLLLVGSVGSGKSTFATYLREVALKKEVRDSTLWVNLDLNDSPLNRDEIYKWLKSNIILKIKGANNDIDFDNLAFILNLYEEEINSLKKGILSLFDQNDLEYKKILAENIQNFQRDIDLTLKKLIKKTVSDNKKTLVIVLDNCDKRNTEEQLLMFDVANWIKDNIKSIVFLPLRETTYENHRFEKPLDTVIKDLIFKINPPNLEQVLSHRISYISEINSTGNDGSYTLSNGMRVTYPSKDEAEYLSSILSSLFENQFFKNMITGFAGRNIRNGIEIFLDFCKSGHINESEITKMIKSGKEYTLPNHLISKVFIRGNKVYYTDEKSRIKNAFHCYPTDKIKDPFIRVSLLKYLYENRNQKKVNGFEGYHNTLEIIKFFSLRGHDENRIIQEVKVLLKLDLLENETLNSSLFNENDLIKITNTGIANYKIIRNIDYLAAMAEDTWYKDNMLANDIATNLSGNGEFSHLSIQSISEHARKLINYLEDYYNNQFIHLNKSIGLDEFHPIDFKLLNSDIDDFDKNIKTNAKPNLKPELEYDATILNIQHYGIICEIVDTPFFGLIHSSELEEDFSEKHKLGATIKVKIKEFKKEHNKYNLRLAK